MKITATIKYKSTPQSNLLTAISEYVNSLPDGTLYTITASDFLYIRIEHLSGTAVHAAAYLLQLNLIAFDHDETLHSFSMSTCAHETI